MEQSRSKDLIIKSYALPQAKRQYKRMASLGLWPSEEIVFERFFSKGALLDLGCGTGRTTIPLFKKGFKVVGVDLSSAMIDSARQVSQELALPIDFRVGDATALEFPDASFDSVLFSYNGWSQIPGKGNRLKALQEIKRVLKPDGTLIFTAYIRRLVCRPHLRWQWTVQWFEFNLFRHLGFKPAAEEYGDMFCMATGDSNINIFYPPGFGQFLHTSSLGEVEKMIKKAGLEIIFSAYRRDIEKASQGVSRSCRFFVCRRPLAKPECSI